MCNDAAGALSALSLPSFSALRKGCASSTFLEQCALRPVLLQGSVTLDATPLFLHAPHNRPIEEGVDGLSRDIGADIAGPVSSQLVCKGPSFTSHWIRAGR